MSISVSVDTTKINELLATIPGNKNKAVREAANYILGEARTLAPVRTGYLKSNSEVEGEGGNSLIKFNAEYAAYVELGTRKMAAQPFLTPAVDRGGERLTALLAEGLLK